MYHCVHLNLGIIAKYLLVALSDFSFDDGSVSVCRPRRADFLKIVLQLYDPVKGDVQNYRGQTNS